MADERKAEELDQETTDNLESVQEGEEAAAQDCEAQDLEGADDAPECKEAGDDVEEDGATDGGDADNAQSDSVAADKEKKGFFAKKKDKKEEAYKTQISELQDKVMRQMAEFENFRKRTEIGRAHV